jgi:hypothetical protein
MGKVLIIVAITFGYFLAIATTPILGVAAPLGEVAIFTEQFGWIAQGTAVSEGKELADLLKKPEDVVTLSDNDIGPWAEKRTDNGFSDIIVTFGSFPASLYPFANAKPEGSVAEKFLEGGNIFLNTADYIFYIVEGKGENGDTALKNMMDINVDMWADATAITPTDDGKKYTPSLGFFTAFRPFKEVQITAPWEVEVVFGDNGAGLLEPAIVHDTETDGRIGIAFQEPNNAGLPRGEVFAEMIDGYLAEVLGAAAVDPNKKVTTTWAHIKSDF